MILSYDIVLLHHAALIGGHKLSVNHSYDLVFVK